MNLLRFLTVTVFSMSMFGCCCCSNVVMDPCDPCSGYSSQSCRPHRHGWLRRPMRFGWNRCGDCGGCGCGSCGGCGDVMMDSGCGGGSCGSPMMGMPSSGGCGCSQTASPDQFSTMSAPINIPSSPTMSAPQMSGPSSLPQLQSAPVPPPMPRTDSTMNSTPAGSQPQMVSYEEFQRLPGTMISGPGTTTATPSPSIQQASAVQTTMSPPPLASQNAKPTSQSRQAIWTQASGY